MRRPNQNDVRLLFQLRTFAGVYDLRRIDGRLVHLLFQNMTVFADQEIHSTCGFVFVDVNTVLASAFAAPIAQKREGYTDGIGKGVVREGTIHAHTQDLGVSSFQLFQILLEVFHLLRSTTGESKDVERKHDLLFTAILAQADFL